MGFDIECIVDIHMYPGEFFCPVCRTLVYPNEAVQAQCTHLYCKSCLSYIANGSKACPYDGYLVTEADSKPLLESDKVLAEKIGQVKVRCLFFRSGCTWEGAFSECNSHCAGCSFGNSPVVCNRCGMQIVHKQVHEHAQSCSGGHEAQPDAVGVVGATGSSTSTAQMSQTVLQQAGPLSQAPTVAPLAAAQTPDQWYQQQYQQYYQQYPGYQAYQQPPQQSYPVQQQPYQQYQQQPAPVQVQNQSSAHSQAAPLPQAHVVPQIPQQSHFQPQAQGQRPVQPQTLVQPQGQAQVVNNHVTQQLPHPPMRTQAQLPPQSLAPPPHGQVAPYPHAMGVRPAAQHSQGSQFEQPPAQMHYPQPSQTHVQPQMHSQPQSQPPPLPQPGNQQHVQVQQAHPYQSQSQPFLRPPPPPGQASGPTPPSHSYQQPQPAPHMHPGYPNPSSAALNPGQVPQQPLAMQPPAPPVGSLPQQQPPMMVPLAHHQQFRPTMQQPPPPYQQRPAMMPVQQPVPLQSAHQLPFNAPFQVQSHQQLHMPQQPIRPNGPPQPQQSQYHTQRTMMSNQSMHPQTVAGTFPHSGPVQLGSKQTSLNNTNLESTRLERNTMNEKGFEMEPIKKEMTEAVDSGGAAANDGLSSIKQDVGTGSSVAKPSEAGMHGSLNGEDLENRDMSLSEVVSGVASSADPDKLSHIASSGYKTKASNGLAPKSHASLQQRPEAFTSNSPSLHMPQGTGTREPGYFGPPSNNSESHSSNQGASFARRDGKMMAFEREHLDPFSVEPTQPPAQSLSYNGNSPHGQKHELNRIGNFGPGPGVALHHMKHFGPRSTDREYLGITGHGFGEGPRSFNPSADPFDDGRFPPSSDHLPRGNIDGPGRYGDHMGPSLFNSHSKRGDFWPGGPDHLMREAFARPDAFSGRDHMTAFHTGSFHGMRNRYPSQSLPNALNFPRVAESFDLSRKRRPMSTGWCRICQVDCETVEGLDMHSQTREHLNMAIDMVKTIKQQNKKKHRASMGHISHEIGRVHQ